MVWLLLCILIVGSDCRQGDFSTPSLSDLVRAGATVVSRFLNRELPKFHSGFRKLKQTADKATGTDDWRNDFILATLRLMGVESRKIDDFAFEGIISMLHLMSQVFLKDDARSREGRKTPMNFSIFRFILSQPQVADLLKDVQDPRLVDRILEESKERLKRFPEKNADCIHLLLCKTKPFVLGMQRSLRFFAERENLALPGDEETCRERAEEESCRKADEGARWEKANLEDRMYFFVPTPRDVISEGDKCDRLFPDCVY